MIKTYINSLKQCDEIDFEQSFNMAKYCLKCLDSEENTSQGHQLIIYVLEYWHKIDKNCLEIWTDIIEKAGFYPYLDKYNDKLSLISTPALIRKEAFHLDILKEKSIYLHEEQKLLFDKILSGKNLIVSAPTSFGKSLLIEATIASNQHKNIVVIQPTLALLNETRKKLSKYHDEYKIIVRTTQEHNVDGKNIFLLTAERLLDYKNLPRIDFLIIDEFYKLKTSEEDNERTSSLNNALYMLLKNNVQFLLLGPNIESISEGFTTKYEAEFYKTQYSLVAQEHENIYESFSSRTTIPMKKQKLFEILYKLKDEQSIIYCASPNQANTLAYEFSQFLSEQSPPLIKQNLDIHEWIEENLTSKWYLYETLLLGIGVHDGSTPRHINSSIIDYFNSRKIKYLFCTTTIIEGVNTSSKNIFYFDKKKGKASIDYFDYSNIRGRAGRMMEHLVGTIYNFNPPPPKEDIKIDIPFYEQNPITDEVLIKLQHEDINVKDSLQVKMIDILDPDLKFLISGNGLSVKGQSGIIDELEKKFNYPLLNWTGLPTYKQLGHILGLAWDYFEGRNSHISKEQLIFYIFEIAKSSGDKSRIIKDLIIRDMDYKKGKANEESKNFNELEEINKSIRHVLYFLRTWVEYKTPKWLSVMNNLQEYVCNKKGLTCGDYSFFATRLENIFAQENLAILAEYNIPHSAIYKIQSKIPENILESDLRSYIIENNILETSNLIQYEKNIIQKNLI